MEHIIHILVKTISLTVLLVLEALIVTWLVQLLLDYLVRLDTIVHQVLQSKLKRNAPKDLTVQLVHLLLSYALQVLTNLMKFNRIVSLVLMAGTVKEPDLHLLLFVL